MSPSIVDLVNSEKKAQSRIPTAVDVQFNNNLRPEKDRVFGNSPTTYDPPVKLVHLCPRSF